MHTDSSHSEGDETPPLEDTSLPERILDISDNTNITKHSKQLSLDLKSAMLHDMPPAML